MGRSHSNKKREIPPFGWLELIVGVILLLFGASLLEDPVVSYKGGVEVDMSPFNVPAAAVSIGIGLYLLWNSMSKTSSDGSSQLKCQECGKVFELKEIANDECPACNSPIKK